MPSGAPLVAAVGGRSVGTARGAAVRGGTGLVSSGSGRYLVSPGPKVRSAVGAGANVTGADTSCVSDAKAAGADPGSSRAQLAVAAGPVVAAVGLVGLVVAGPVVAAAAGPVVAAAGVSLTTGLLAPPIRKYAAATTPRPPRSKGTPLDSSSGIYALMLPKRSFFLRKDTPQKTGT